MTSAEVAAAIAQIMDTDDVGALARLEATLRAAHAHDPDVETILRQAALKRQRLVGTG